MDSWTLQGDSYSFLRSAPRTFSLCHRDGTPNHVEIFDIINVPTQRSAISETTCLCDIFGDDCELPSHSSGPAVGAFVPSQREVDGTSAASPLVDDLNDSGSYHTAQGSSEGEEGFEDSRERLYSPLSQNESAERRQSEGEGFSSGHPDNFEDRSPNLEPKSKSPVPQLSTPSPPPEVLDTGERTPSPGHNSSYTISPEGRASSLSSSSVEKRSSPSSSNPSQTHSEAEPGRITPTFKDRLNSPSHQSLTPSPSSEPRNCVSSSSSVSVNTQSSPECRGAQNSPDPSPKDFSLDFTESATPSSPLPSRSRRVSLPDLFSIGSTPDIEEPPCSPELISDPSAAGGDTTATPENQNSRLSVEPGSTASTPAPRYTPPSPVISISTSPELVENSVSPELGHTAPSPGLLSAASPAKTGTRTPSPGSSPKIRHISPLSEISTQVPSPVVSYSLSPSPEVRSNCSPVEHRHTAPSPEIRITASSPEPHFDTASSRSFTSSPHITGISYTVVQPDDRDTPPFPEPCRLSTPEPDRTAVSPEASSPTQSRDSTQGSVAESTGTPRDSPHISGFTSPVLQPELTLSHPPRYQTPSPQPKHHTPSPEPKYQTPSPDKHRSPSPQHLRSRDPSPVSPSPEQISPVTLSTEYHPQYTHPTPPLRSTPEVERDSSSANIAETRCHENLVKDNQPPGMAGAPYSDPGHSHSPGLPPMDPQYLCGAQSLGPSYGSEYGGDSSSLYSESNYGQTPRRVLLDPETGKYFYIEVPVQPLRKMLFDPETGQYVEVLIPQQAMSHSGLYPPSAAPYPSLHNPNMYAPAPQYMPYAAPPPPAHPQAQPQPPRYPEASAAATMHPSGPGVSYRNHSGQGSKPEHQNNPPLDQSYLESMYYVPTGMNASPNPTPPDYYHKHPPNLPPTGGKRS
uniref:Serine/arginine repetitive matrix protein 2-like n=1 Tax=Seriola lalandi dorsalis TaxID=1841481 RepID=A0A3B4XP96_SERLL